MSGERQMEGKREEIRKGPWKAEEDEVLINHVNKYGPRDWSSIRSKGFLQRTGKSCRLRWVNKLRPNLKNGCKFSAEEESVVIDLQAQFGNKWARIATYLPGRTDNDVKNFWSSRQKRLARILHASTPSSSTSKTHKINRELPSLEVPNLRSSMEEELPSRIHACSTSSLVEISEPISMVPLPDLVNPNLDAAAAIHLAPPIDQINLQIPNPSFSYENQQLLTRLDEDPYFFDVVLGPLDSTEISLGQSFFEPAGRSCSHIVRDENANSVTPDAFFDDFPADMFDQMESFPSPSHTS